MSKKDEALQLALEALVAAFQGKDKTGQVTDAITAIREALVDSALDRMAENARELGLDYEPPCKTGSQCTSKCQQCEQPAQQQEPMAWMKDCADFWEHYTYISEASQENYKAEAQMWVEKLRTSPQPSKPWVGLSTVELDEIDAPIRERGHATIAEIYRAIEAKLREKNT